MMDLNGMEWNRMKGYEWIFGEDFQNGMKALWNKM